MRQPSLFGSPKQPSRPALSRSPTRQLPLLDPSQRPSRPPLRRPPSSPPLRPRPSVRARERVIEKLLARALAGLTPDKRYEFEERVAIAVHDGGLYEADAVDAALSRESVSCTG